MKISIIYSIYPSSYDLWNLCVCFIYNFGLAVFCLYFAIIHCRTLYLLSNCLNLLYLWHMMLYELWVVKELIMTLIPVMDVLIFPNKLHFTQTWILVCLFLLNNGIGCIAKGWNTQIVVFFDERYCNIRICLLSLNVQLHLTPCFPPHAQILTTVLCPACSSQHWKYGRHFTVSVLSSHRWQISHHFTGSESTWNKDVSFLCSLWISNTAALCYHLHIVKGMIGPDVAIR